MTGDPILRFAVGTFDSWAQVRNALRDLRLRGMVLDSFNCLALEKIFAGKMIVTPDQARLTVQPLPFPGNGEPIACTSGPLADCLSGRLDAGAGRLGAALVKWLIPRHARHIEDAVAVGKIVLWIRVADANEERQACQSLLAHSSNSVGVHDLVALDAQ